MAKVKTINISGRKGEKKNPIEQAELLAGHGIVGDAHAGSARQISLLAEESIDKLRARGFAATAGVFAENLTTEGIDLLSLSIGNKVQVGGAVLEITALGKVCHQRCHIYYEVGDCVMPREGVFARVVSSGIIRKGDEIELL